MWRYNPFTPWIIPKIPPLCGLQDPITPAWVLSASHMLRNIFLHSCTEILHTLLFLGEGNLNVSGISVDEQSHTGSVFLCFALNPLPQFRHYNIFISIPVCVLSVERGADLQLNLQIFNLWKWGHWCHQRLWYCYDCSAKSWLIFILSGLFWIKKKKCSTGWVARWTTHLLTHLQYWSFFEEVSGLPGYHLWVTAQSESLFLGQILACCPSGSHWWSGEHWQECSQAPPAPVEVPGVAAHACDCTPAYNALPVLQSALTGCSPLQTGLRI